MKSTWSPRRRTLPEPVRERELRVAAQTLRQQIQRLLDVARAHEDVEVLHEAADAEIALERVAAAHEEIDVGRAQLAEHAAIKPQSFHAGGCILARRAW